MSGSSSSESRSREGKISRRKFVAAGAGIAAVAAVGGAAYYLSRAGPSPTVTTGSPTVAPTTTTAPVGYPDFKGREISIMLYEALAAPHDTFKEIFNVRTGAKVNIVVVPDDEFHTRVFLEFFGKTGLDLIAYWTRWKGEMAKGNYLIKLDDWVQANIKDVYDSWPEVIQKQQITFPDGSIRSVAIDGDCSLTFYRKDIFDRMGLDHKKLRTPDGRLEILKALNNGKETAKGGGQDLNGDGKIDFWAYCYHYARKLAYEQTNFQTTWHYYEGEGSSLLDENRNPTFNDQNGVDALNMVLEYMKYLVPNGLDTNFSEIMGRYANGEVGMFPDTGGGWRTWFEKEGFSKVIGKTNYEPLPVPTAIYGPCVGVNADSKNQDVALEYLKEYIQPEIQLKVNLGRTPWGPNYCDPIQKPIWDNPEIRAAYPGFVEAWSESYGMTGRFTPRWDFPYNEPNAQELMDLLDYYLNEAYHYKMKPKDALDTCAAEWKKKLT